MIILNGTLLPFPKFPNKECYIDLRMIKPNMANQVEWVYQDDAEFFKLALLKDELDKQRSTSSLTITYMPYSRMDRSNSSYAFSLKTAAKLINDMNFWAVTINEPHSDVTSALIKNVHAFEWCPAALDKVILKSGCNSLFYPDAGAAKRYPSDKMKYGVGSKLRDFKTGAITDYAISGYVGQHVLIVDDLCSKGGTFVYASKQLKAAGAMKVDLLVAHCENNVFNGELFDHITTLYTSENNIMEKRHPQIIFVENCDE